tara:strand:- start:1464 stop:2552 length:1089 start_codon:yes stop_codon:yes gene_type:complete
MALTFTEDSPSQLTISNSGGKDIVLTNDPSNPTTIPQFAPGSKVSIQGTLYGQVPSSSYGGVGTSTPVTYTMARSPASGAVNEGTTVTFTVTASDGSTSPYPYTITGVTSPDFNPSGTSLTGTGTLGTGVPFTLANDLTTEGTETMTFTIPGSYTGPQQSLSVPISDTSTTPGGGGGGGSGPFLVLGPLSAPYTTYPNSTGGINNVWFRRSIIRYNLTAPELSTAGLSSPTTLTSISWDNLNVPTRPTQPNFTIALAPTANLSTSSAVSSPQTIVRNPSPYTWTSPGPTTFPFTTPWTYPGSNGIQITVKWDQVNPNYASSGQMKFRGPGSMFYTRTDGTGSYPLTNPTPQSNSARPITEFN